MKPPHEHTGMRPEKSPYPRLMMLEWHITRRCNLSCPFCYIEYDKKYKELDDSACLAMLDQIRALGIPGIIFSGGEPLLRKELLLSLITKAAAGGIRCVLATNALLLDEPTLLQLKQAGLNIVGMSLDGACAATHDRIRGHAGSFAAVLKALELCRSIELSTHIQTCSMRSNYQELPAIMALCERNGVYKHLVLDFVPSGRGETFNDEVLDHEQRETLLEYVYWASKLLDKKMIVEYVEPYWIRKVTQHEPQRGAILRERFYQGGLCMGGNSFAALMPDGSLYPCPRFPVAAGNVSTDSFDELWKHAEIFRLMRSWSELTGDCISCAMKHLCDGCRARTRVERDDYRSADPNCIWIKTQAHNQVAINPGAGTGQGA